MKARDIKYRKGPISEGDLFGRLTALAATELRCVGTHTRRKFRLCVCSCGSELWLSEHALKSGNTRSCGCLLKDTPHPNYKHGMGRTRAYRIWAGMKGRCYAPRHPSFARYGGRGIKVCDRWVQSFEHFVEDMGHPPDGLNIDRIDNAGDYTPDNCRWVTQSQNMRNMKNNRIIIFHGESMTMIEAIERVGISRSTFYSRTRKGMTVHDALTTPVDRSRSRKRLIP